MKITVVWWVVDLCFFSQGVGYVLGNTVMLSFVLKRSVSNEQCVCFRSGLQFLPGNKAKVSTLSCNALEVLVDVIRGKGNEKAERNKTVPFANDILIYIDNSKESLKKRNLLKLISAFSKVTEIKTNIILKNVLPFYVAIAMHI